MNAAVSNTAGEIAENYYYTVMGNTNYSVYQHILCSTLLVKQFLAITETILTQSRRSKKFIKLIAFTDVINIHSNAISMLYNILLGGIMQH